MLLFVKPLKSLAELKTQQCQEDLGLFKEVVFLLWLCCGAPGIRAGAWAVG